MKTADIPNIRLHNQHIAGTYLKSPKQIVDFMGAIQAQDYEMCKWAIGSRLQNSTISMVDEALAKGDIIRTHVLRPTWQLVSRDDIYWLLQLTAGNVKAAMKSNDKKLELTDALFSKSNKLIENALSGNKHLTRDELMIDFKNAGITITDNRASHFLLRAEAEGIICSGSPKNKTKTYTLLHELIPKPPQLSKDEALAKLALTYFKSRSPASVHDFTWWSGLSVTDARHALEIIKHNFVSERIDKQEYWLNADIMIPQNLKPSVHLLPAFDEYLISYADRTAVLPLKHQPHAFTLNGIFRPVVVVNGKVTGIWKRTFTKTGARIETNFFIPLPKQLLAKINKAVKTYGKFLGQPTDLFPLHG